MLGGSFSVPDNVDTLASRKPVSSKIIRAKAWSMVGSEGLGEPLGICQKSEKAFGSVPPTIRISASVCSLYSDNLSLQTDPDDRNMVPDCRRMFWNSIPV